MLHIQRNVPLTAINTLAIDATARYFVDIKHQQQIPLAWDFAQQQRLPVLVLGGGSNIVLTGDFSGLVIKMALRGIQFCVDKADPQQVIVTAAAAENWHELVQTCLTRHYYGLENLSLIPGSVGAAPIQNIGAYGVELEQRFVSLTGWDCQQRCWRTLNGHDCQFGYRDSVFKQQLKDCFVITSVSLRLSTEPEVDIRYDALQQALLAQGMSDVHKITPEQVAQAVIGIRQRKLPDPDQVPNAGSFFKNPIVSVEQFNRLKQRYPAMVSYPQHDGSVKLAAGWLLEQAGWKGKQQGAVGMHKNQALVLINSGRAGGDQVIALARAIQRDIQQQFGLDLIIEPAIY